jgi:Fe-S-cluster-containing hydrogenase component 2
MAKRKIIEIDRDMCNGCALCTTACAEGALALDEENKAVLVKEIYCDGLGACLDVCPTGALTIVDRVSDGYDATAAYGHVLSTRGEEAARQVHGAEATRSREGARAGKKGAAAGAATGASSMGTEARRGESRVARSEAKGSAQDKIRTLACGCPGSAAQVIRRENRPEGAAASAEHTVSGASELRQWPIQLHLVSPYAPYFREAELLIAADCTAFSLGSFHQDLLKGKMLVIACPKLDETEGYIDKLAELIRENRPKSITVAIMTVPCCSGLYRMVEEAVRLSGTGLPLERKLVHIDGRIVA